MSDGSHCKVSEEVSSDKPDDAVANKEEKNNMVEKEICGKTVEAVKRKREHNDQEEQVENMGIGLEP